MDCVPGVVAASRTSTVQDGCVRLLDALYRAHTDSGETGTPTLVRLVTYGGTHRSMSHWILTRGIIPNFRIFTPHTNGRISVTGEGSLAISTYCVAPFLIYRMV